MKKLYLLFILLFAFTQVGLGQTPNAWINEFHYDNVGGDIGEFVEIAIENATDYNLSSFTVSLYRDVGTVYGSENLSNFTQESTDNNITLFTWEVVIQNGLNDGIALTYSGDGGEVIQLLSYEGTLTAISGPAIGTTSVDIGVSQSSSTPIGSSVGLQGTGTSYSQFTWTNYDASATSGSQNSNQALPVELTSFTAKAHAKGVMLNWSTATEVNNYGFDVEKKAAGSWEKISFVEGHGNSNSPKEYSFIDKAATIGEVSYRLKQVDIDGAFEYSDVVTVTSANLAKNELHQNHPNPFNPSTAISFSLAELAHVNITVYNAIGQKVMELANEQMDAGIHNVNFDGSSLSTGFYFYRLETPNYSKTMKMMLIK